jgi:DnaK suppressor protein
MTAFGTADANSPESLPRWRRRGRRDAGCSDQLGRINPRAATRPARTPSAEFIESAQETLKRLQRFRTEQLQQLESTAPDAAREPARAEVHLALREAARSALRDIDHALRRIQNGSYGRCAQCGEGLSMERLATLPMAAQCGSCQLATQRMRRSTTESVRARPRATIESGGAP